MHRRSCDDGGASGQRLAARRCRQDDDLWCGKLVAQRRVRPDAVVVCPPLLGQSADAQIVGDGDSFSVPEQHRGPTTLATRSLSVEEDQLRYGGGFVEEQKIVWVVIELTLEPG
jgi:hypothetical protein